MSQYDSQFYDQINEGSIRSAKVVVPIIMSIWKPKSVIDFGCGEGAWLSIFKEYGCNVFGIDGNYVNRLLIDDSEFCPWDLQDNVRDLLNCRYDIATSLEVAEHLPESSADDLVDGLCQASDLVIFSAAIPGQKGVGHINEQWPTYWEKKFNALGYQGEEILRDEIWDNHTVENWYRQNLLVFFKQMGKPNRAIKDVVHPANWHDHLIGGKYD